MAEVSKSSSVPGRQDARMGTQTKKTSKRNSRPIMNWVMKNQIPIASSWICTVLFFHIVSPESRKYTRKFLQLSYPVGDGGTYRQGIDDAYFVFAWVINFTAIRAITIEWILIPFASYLGVVKKTQLRFAEQSWLVLYYGIFWTLGMHLWYNSAYWLNNSEIWTYWPGRDMSGLFKWYNLVQLANWFQQILVIHIEARRKDHAQMLTHHVITSTLISITYVYRYTRAANVVLCLMDLVDLIFPFAKILRYLRYEAACNVAFVVFVVSWIMSRHVMYLNLCYDIYMDVPGPTTMYYGCYNGATSELIPELPAHPDYFSHLLLPFKDLDGVICLNTEVKYIFLGMLLFLQTLSLIWFTMILKIIVGVLMGGRPEDTRSDDEADEEEEDEEVHEAEKNNRPMDITDLNVCVGGGAEIDEKEEVSTMTSPKPRGATTARRRLMDAESRKELLARIGCEKPI